MDEHPKLDPTDFRSTLPRFTPEAMKANQALVDLLGRIAARKNSTPAQIALAWLLAQKPWIVPIPGTTKLRRLEENIGAEAITLTPDDLREIGTAAAKIRVQGARYPEKLERMTGRGAPAECGLAMPSSVHLRGQHFTRPPPHPPSRGVRG